MKLVVTIPAYNEEKNLADVIREIPRDIDGVDVVEVLVLNDGSRDATVSEAQKAGADVILSHRVNQGLAATFSDAIEEALRRGADIIVNTDGDNHYNQSRIGDLIAPVLKEEADVAIGSRKVEELEHMPVFNKYGNLLANRVFQRAFALPGVDFSTGFRAYSRNAALKMLVYSRHTYTHETLIQAKDLGLGMVSVPIKARKVTRKSRLIKSLPRHIVKSLVVIFRSFVLYKPLRAFLMLGLVSLLPGLVLLGRFLYFYVTDGGQGHIQSLVVSAIFILAGLQFGILGLVASAVGWNRRLNEQILYRMKRAELGGGDVVVSPGLRVEKDLEV